MVGSAYRLLKSLTLRAELEGEGLSTANSVFAQDAELPLLETALN